MKPLHLFIALAVVLVWGCNFVVIEIGLRDLSPMLFAALRFAFSALPAIFLVKRPKVPLGYLAAYGFLIFGVQFGLLFTGMHAGVSAGLASLVLQVQAFMTIGLGALLMKERPSGLQLLGTVIGGVGIAVVAANLGGDVSVAGLAWVLAAALAWACGNLISKKIGKVDMLGLVVWGSLFGAIPLAAAALWIDGPAQVGTALAHISVSAVAAIAFNVILSTYFGYGAWSLLLSRYPTASVVPFTLLVPVVGMTAASFMLGEPLQHWKLAAAALVLAGLCINVFGTRSIGRQAAA